MLNNSKNLIMRYLLILPLLLVFVAGIYATEAKAGGPLGLFKFEDCEVNEYGIDCEEKAVLTLPVTYGLEQNLEVLQVYQISEHGEPQTVEETYTISIKKSKPVETYPLRYLHTVSYFPYEQVIQVPHPLSGCEGCIDCWDAEVVPTCWRELDDGTRIEDSQGFCIEKTLEELEGTCSWFRGEELFGERATTENPYSTAHCMRLGELFYDGYEIGEYTRSYEIELEVVKGEETHTFKISPSDPLYSCRDDEEYNGDLKMKAELIGDMDEYQGAVELDNYILYIPASPDSHPFVQDYQNNMLLVPREEVSRDGGEPDKVGVSFYTFRRLGSDYRVSQAGDGLHNQLFQKHNSDLQKLISRPDDETTYLVHGKKDFKGSMTFEAGMAKELKHQVTYINNSLISITDRGVESVKVIKTESIGAIIEAYVEKFTSMSDNGTLVAKIGNFGDLKSNYIVTVTDANMNVDNRPPAQARTLEPYEEIELKFDVSTRFNLADNTSNEFLVTLKSDTGRVYDKIEVIFDTDKHGTKYSWELQQENEASENTSAMAGCANQPPDCSNAAPSIETIWPANNKFVPVNITGVTDPDGDPVTITITSIMQDEPVDTVGDGKFVPDGKGIGTDTAEVRAERSGTAKVPGNGRVYTIGFTASDGKGSECSGTVKVVVPHDVKDTPVDDGELYDSTAEE